MIGSLSKKEVFAGLFLATAFTGVALASMYGITLPYFTIELSRGLYCFSGFTKNIFLVSIILWAPSINTIIYAGLKIKAGYAVDFIKNKIVSVLLLGTFFGASIGVFGSLFIASRQCG